MKASNSIKRYDCLVHDHDSITTNGERKEYERKKETKKGTINENIRFGSSELNPAR